MLRPNQNLFLSLITSGFHQCQSLINSRHLNRPSGNTGDGRAQCRMEGTGSQGQESWVQSCPGLGRGLAAGLGGCRGPWLPLVQVTKALPDWTQASMRPFPRTPAPSSPWSAVHLVRGPGPGWGGSAPG